MTALLVLYMVNQLLLPGHVEHVAGFAAFRAMLESAFGPLSTQALASQIFGLYSGFVYFTPVLGGWVADRWIGQRNAVVLGALSMSGGHLAMAFDQSFLLALLLLVIGSGLLKGNISAQVGGLYPPDDESAADARLRDLQHGDQFRRGCRAAAVRIPRRALRLARRLRRRRAVHARRARDLSQRLSTFAGKGGAQNAADGPDDRG